MYDQENLCVCPCAYVHVEFECIFFNFKRVKLLCGIIKFIFWEP